MASIGAKPIASELKSEIEGSISQAREDGISPCMAIIRVGNDPASEFYFRAKLKRASEFGVETRAITLGDDASAGEVSSYIDELAGDPDVHGIIMEAPLPGNLNYKKLVNGIPWMKDIDGATYESLGRLMSGDDCLVAATPLAVMEYLKFMGIEQGSQVAVINRTITVGRPLSQLLLNSNYTPTVCHSRTRNLEEVCRNSDVIVVAAGKPGFLTQEMTTGDSVVVDVGINSVNGKMTGDADFEALKNNVRMITPVPGGVGSLTSLIIFQNLVKAIGYQINRSDGT